MSVYSPFHRSFDPEGNYRRDISCSCTTCCSHLRKSYHQCSEGPTHPLSESSQKPPFWCGCGKCTFFSFIERGCPTPIPSASSFPYLDLSGLTLEMQCDPTSSNAYYSIALHLAVVEGDLDITRFFISDQNCDPNIPGQHGRTPLHCAAEYGHLHIVKYLIEE